jgi:ribosomal protein S11
MELQKPSIAIATAHSVHLQKTYNNMKILLEEIQYNVHQWNICGDLKVTGMLMDMQGGFISSAASYAFGIITL